MCTVIVHYIGNVAERTSIQQSKLLYSITCVFIFRHFSETSAFDSVWFQRLNQLWLACSRRQGHDLVSSTVDRQWLVAWWRHQMETFSALLALCAGNSPATGEFPAQRPVTRSFDVFFDLPLNKRLSKQSWCWWFETPSHSLRRHSNMRSLSTQMVNNAKPLTIYCDSTECVLMISVKFSFNLFTMSALTRFEWFIHLKSPGWFTYIDMIA